MVFNAFQNFATATMAVMLVAVESQVNGAFVPTHSVGSSKNGIHPPVFQSTAFVPYGLKTTSTNNRNNNLRQKNLLRLDTFQGFQQPLNVTIDEINDQQDSSLIFETNGKDVLEAKKFVYGSDSTCYRGLTSPSKAAVALAILLSAGMVATSPEIDLSGFSSFLLEDGMDFPSWILQDASLTSMMDRLAFEWEMSSLPQSFQHITDQIAPALLRQQEHLQESLTTFSSQSDEWMTQTAFQLGDVEDVVLSKLSELQGSASIFVRRLSDMAAEKTTAWKMVVDSISNDLQRETTQRSIEIQTQFETLADLSRNKLHQTSVISSRIQDEGSQLLNHYSAMAAIKYRDFEAAAQSQLQQMTNLASDVEAGGSQLLSRFGDTIVDKYSIIESFAQSKFSAAILDLNEKASTETRQFAVVATEKYNEIEQTTLKQLANVQKDSETAGSILLGHLDHVQEQGKMFVSSKWSTIQPAIQEMGVETRNDIASFGEQLLAEERRVSEDVQASVARLVHDVQRVGQEQLSILKSEYPNAVKNFRSAVFRLMEDSSLKATSVENQLEAGIGEAQQAIIQFISSVQSAMALKTEQFQNHKDLLSDAVGSTTKSLFEERAPQLLSLRTSVANKVLELQSSEPAGTDASSSTTFLKEVLERK